MRHDSFVIQDRTASRESIATRIVTYETVFGSKKAKRIANSVRGADGGILKYKGGRPLSWTFLADIALTVSFRLA